MQPLQSADPRQIGVRLVRGRVAPGCAWAVWGTRLRRALSAARCTQAARGTYLTSRSAGLGTGYMTMVVVFNLQENAEARQVAAIMGPSIESFDLVTEHTERPGNAGFLASPAAAPFSALGDTHDNEAEAEAMGHFLVVTWAQGPGENSNTDFALLSVQAAAVSPVKYALVRRDVAVASGR